LTLKEYTIYRLISPSGKSYIGFTSRTFKVRFSEHVRYWKLGRRGCHKLYDAFNKYPPELWTHEILFKSYNREEAEGREIEHIEGYASIKHGYNIFPGGGLSRLGVKLTEEELIKNIEGHKGIIPSFETRAKMSLTRTGKVQSLETRNKIRLAHMGMNPTEETRQKLCKPKSEAHKLNMRISRQNKKAQQLQESICVS